MQRPTVRRLFCHFLLSRDGGQFLRFCQALVQRAQRGCNGPVRPRDRMELCQALRQPVLAEGPCSGRPVPSLRRLERLRRSPPAGVPVRTVKTGSAVPGRGGMVCLRRQAGETTTSHRTANPFDHRAGFLPRRSNARRCGFGDEAAIKHIVNQYYLDRNTILLCETMFDLDNNDAITTVHVGLI
jgi:hypothetical protein